MSEKASEEREKKKKKEERRKKKMMKKKGIGRAGERSGGQRGRQGARRSAVESAEGGRTVGGRTRRIRRRGWNCRPPPLDQTQSRTRDLAFETPPVTLIARPDPTARAAAHPAPVRTSSHSARRLARAHRQPGPARSLPERRLGRRGFRARMFRRRSNGGVAHRRTVRCHPLCRPHRLDHARLGGGYPPALLCAFVGQALPTFSLPPPPPLPFLPWDSPPPAGLHRYQPSSSR